MKGKGRVQGYRQEGRKEGRKGADGSCPVCSVER